ncbi:class I SAM-dependent methyltransferase [Geobacter grbiciae]|uniref:class I SAM-dependent methyltransferase n=1 Tax=Geobacter grbiciae TaxID=155042 RepID=UPI001FE87CEA|nr:class I SAM-dependent methyltransferase [Geobacter grbiciae]
MRGELIKGYEMVAETIKSFCGDRQTTVCRICGEILTETTVTSGQQPYETTWILCGACGSWSIGREPDIERLNAFYSDYSVHHKMAATNTDANDGKRYSDEWRETREREYRLSINDIGLELEQGKDLVDFGAYDGVFLDVCRATQPNLGKSTAVDYPREDTLHLAARGHNFEPINEWMAGESLTDIVTLWDVYEHIADLPGLLTTLSRRVKSGGQVLIQTPHAHVHAQILGPQWHHFLPVQHLQLPSREGILRQFDRYGFTAVQVASFGANAPGSIIPQPYKQLFDTLAKLGDLGSTQLIRFVRR